MAEATGWFTGGDGALCIDLNGDGIINNSSELFGNQTGYNNGFLALKAYDSNGDGFVTSADSIWGNLRVWIENRVDGISETTELHTLNELSISSVNLSYTDVNYTLSENTIKQQSTFVINGNSRNIVDAYFLYSDHNTINNSGYTFDERVVNLPDLRGYGDLPNLYIAESRGNIGVGNLLDLVGALEIRTFAAIFDCTNALKNDIRSILFNGQVLRGFYRIAGEAKLTVKSLLS